MSDIFPAATVVLIRDVNNDGGLEVLMLRRSKAVKFAGGAWVFPGGRIDAEDYGKDADDITKAAYTAAIRETREETGLTLVSEDLLYFSHWTAPPQTSKRFATWFFIARANNVGDVIVDGGEIDSYFWYRPQDAIDALNKKKIKMMPPTFVTLVELSKCSSTAAALAMYSDRKVMKFKPKIIIKDDDVCALYPGDVGYDSGDSTLEGEFLHRLWMLDSGWVYEKTI